MSADDAHVSKSRSYSRLLAEPKAGEVISSAPRHYTGTYDVLFL